MFFGVLNFIKNHIPWRAKICEPITRLTKKDVKFVWGEEQQQAFDKLKAVVSEAILLTYPNPNRPFDIYSDASSTYAMGAVLMQDGKINFRSGTLYYHRSDRERHRQNSVRRICRSDKHSLDHSLYSTRQLIIVSIDF